MARRDPIVLRPGAPTLTIGRSRSCSLRVGHDSAGGGPDLEVSRNVASIWWADRLWWLRNDSTTRPVDIVVHGARISLLPQASDDDHLVWPISQPGLTVMIAGPFGPYELGLSVDYGHERPECCERGGDVEPSTNKIPPVTPRDRLILAAKFLAHPGAPGDAIGDADAAARANVALAGVGRLVTPKAVEDSVAKWRFRLQQRGVSEIDGQRHINDLGRTLLAWGVLRQQDRRLLCPPASREL